MISELADALKATLSASGTPAEVADADIAFDRPADGYNPQTTTINLFLYDIREHAELRSNEPVTERQNGVVTMRRPPLRVACSYLVTVWTAADLIGEEAILKQHELLGEVLRVFAGMPAIPAERLTGDLAAQPYPVPLVTLQSELMRNPAEFWSALGGKLRPSFTLTATLAMEIDTAPIEAPEVATQTLVLGGLAPVERRPNRPQPEAATQTLVPGASRSHRIGGTVRRADDGAPLAAVAVSLPALGRATLTDTKGHFTFSGLDSGTFDLVAAKEAFATVNRSITVPGGAPTAFDIQLSPNP